jgi:hypothetical protein
MPMHRMLDMTPHSSLGLQTDNELHPQQQPRSALRGLLG